MTLTLAKALDLHRPRGRGQMLAALHMDKTCQQTRHQLPQPVVIRELKAEKLPVLRRIRLSRQMRNRQILRCCAEKLLQVLQNNVRPDDLKEQ